MQWRRLRPEFEGDGVGALAPTNFFAAPPQIMKFGGDGRGLTVCLLELPVNVGSAAPVWLLYMVTQAYI